MQPAIRVVVCLATVTLLAASAQGATLRVPADHATIDDAVSAASTGDRIEVSAGTWNETLHVDKDLILVGVDGSAATTITASDGTEVIQFRDSVVRFEGFAVTNTGNGTAIHVHDATVDMVDVRLVDNDGDNDGGAMWVHNGSTVTVDASVFANNATTKVGGHLAVHDATVTVTSSTFTDGAAADGGAIHVDDATVVLVDVQLSDSVTDGAGGHVYVDGNASLSATATTFERGYATGAGGAIRIADVNATLALTGCTLDDNHSTASVGGAIAASGPATLAGGTLTGNSAAGGGGALWSRGDLTVDDATFTGNSADYGGAVAVYDSPAAVLRGSTFTANAATAGGGVWLTAPGADFALEDCTFTANTASAGGALVAFDVGDIVARRNLFCTNHATGTDGGAVWTGEIGATGSNLWSNNWFVENTAAGDGGGLYATGLVADVRYNDFLGNAAGGSGGGAAFDDVSGKFTGNLLAWTVSGDGLWVTGQPLPYAYNATWSNTVQHTSGLLSVGSGNFTADPVLAAYSLDADCGNDAFHLASGSPLIDAADPTETDPDGSAADIGAYGGPAAPPDADGDGVPWPADCDDGDASVYPGATEVCDAADVDEDCDGLADDLDPDGTSGTVQWYVDGDGDGYGDDQDLGTAACDAPAGHVADATDCDDGAGAVHPGAAEVCDALDIDEDCDGASDDTDPEGAAGATAWYADADGDGWGDTSDAVLACDPLPGRVSDDTDCDDGDAGVHPAAPEVCDAGDVDEDCDGFADNADPDGSEGTTPWYLDVDGDQYGDPGEMIMACDAPGRVADATDCDDGDGDVHPGATEACDPDDIDEDCDGLADDLDPDGASETTDWYADADGDGWGDALDVVAACEPPAGRVSQQGDCDDGAAWVNPDGTEVCDDQDADEDCDGFADDADPDGAIGPSAWYPDADLDGWGDLTAAAALACDPPPQHVADSTDCDDAAQGVNPGATEACDPQDIDEDCDGAADDADPSVTGLRSWCPDADGDGFGDASATPIVACDGGALVADCSDCDDGDPSRYPGAKETLEDGIDQDCDGVDPGVWYRSAVCGCGGGGAPGWWAILPALVLLRRRS